MGGKLSKFSCVSKQDGHRKYKKSKKRRRPKLGKRPGDKQTQDLIFVDRSGSSASRVTADRSPRLQDDSRAEKVSIESLTKFPEVVLVPTREVQKLETIAECEENSAEYKLDRLNVPRNKHVGQLIQDTSKKIGNSIELLPCPDMSTISIFTEASCVRGGGRGIAAGAPAETLLTPHGVTGDEFTVVTPLENGEYSAMENTKSTLTVPPNSVNSQFISGITPMDSIQDVDYPDATRDSVFAHDLSYIPEHCLDAVFFANFGAGRVLLNNNSLIASPEYVDVKSKSGKRNTKPANSFEVSDGPGLDSDFGASAGVEMRIVSSDFSGANSNATAAAERGNVTVDVGNLGKTTLSVPDARRKRASASDALNMRRAKKARKAENFATRTLPIVEMVPSVDANGYLAYGLVLRGSDGARRPATVGGPDGLLQATMEWDPYDTDYGNWREYFIPGVSYPPRPVLCPEEFWM